MYNKNVIHYVAYNLYYSEFFHNIILISIGTWTVSTKVRNNNKVFFIYSIALFSSITTNCLKFALNIYTHMVAKNCGNKNVWQIRITESLEKNYGKLNSNCNSVFLSHIFKCNWLIVTYGVVLNQYSEDPYTGHVTIWFCKKNGVYATHTEAINC